MIANSNGVVAAAAETAKYEQVQRKHEEFRATNHQIDFFSFYLFKKGVDSEFGIKKGKEI